MLKNTPFFNWFKLTLLLIVLWYIMSGILEVKFIVFGVLSAVIISCVCFREFTLKGYKSGESYYIMNANAVRYTVYTFWLLKELVKAALYVSKVVTFERNKLKPRIVCFRADYDNPVARVVLANSITLTPGTVTVDILDNGVYAVHALTDELAEGLLDGTMQNKVAWAYGETIDFTPLKTINKKSGNGIAVPALKRTVYKGKGKALKDLCRFFS